MIRAIVSSVNTPDETAVDYTLGPNVLLLLLEDGTARLLDLDGDAYTLSSTAASMLDDALHDPLAATVRRMVDRYGIDQHRAEADIRVFLSELERKGLLRRIAPTTETAPTHCSTPAPRWVVTLLRMIHACPASLPGRIVALLTVAYFATRWSGWTGTVAAWRLHYLQPSLSSSAGSNRQIDAIDQAVHAVAARHPLKIGCKERALCSWGLVRGADQPAKLILAVELFPMACHCWCQLGSRIIGDDEERCVRFTPVTEYD